MAFNRIFSTLFLAAFALLLSACSGGQPESVVESFYEAAADGDVEKATELMALNNVPAAQMMQAKGKVQMIVGEMQNRINANGGLDDVEILESKVAESKKTAVVRVKIKYKNGKDQTQSHNMIDEDGDWKLLLK